MSTKRTYICYGSGELMKVNGAGFDPVPSESIEEARTTPAGALRIKRYCKRVGRTFERIDVTAQP